MQRNILVCVLFCSPTINIAILGGGPSAIFIYKRLIEEAVPGSLHIDIFEKMDRLGCGMPYGRDGSAAEHVTNVSGNEIPKLVTPVSEWTYTVSKDTLHQYQIDPTRSNDY